MWSNALSGIRRSRRSRRTVRLEPPFHAGKMPALLSMKSNKSGVALNTAYRRTK